MNKLPPCCLAKTPRGRARQTIHWFGSGHLWIWDYDLLVPSQFKQLMQLVKSPPNRRNKDVHEENCKGLEQAIDRVRADRKLLKELLCQNGTQ